MAIELGASFVARSFSGDKTQQCGFDQILRLRARAHRSDGGGGLCT
jgi:hypothetical protein